MKKNKNILLICLLLSFYSCSDNNPEYLFSDGINDDNEVVNEEVVKVEVKEDKISKLQIENEKKKGQIQIHKVDADNNEYGIKK